MLRFTDCYNAAPVWQAWLCRLMGLTVNVCVEVLWDFRVLILMYTKPTEYMKSSFPKRDKRQIYHAILLCNEPIHCSNVSCQIAIFPCLKCTSLS